MSKIYEPIPIVPPSSGGIEAYANVTSISQGETISFHVWIKGADSNNPQNFSVGIFREEEFQISITTLNGFSFEQPTNKDPSVNGCGWNSSVEWVIPLNMKRGAYRAVFTSGSETTYIVFFIKPSKPGDINKILFVGSVTTWESYNAWGGKSLYYGEDGTFESRARKVSFNRPPRIYEFDRWELPFIKWFYRSINAGQLTTNTEMDYCSSFDLHSDPTIVNNYKLVLSVGHDEYWSWEMRNTIQDFITNNNGNVAFFSGNICWWQIRFEGDEKGNDDRTLVCYKNFEEDRLANPSVPDDHITINWFEKIINRPENLMTGVRYYFGTALWNSYITPYKIRLQKHWLLKDTGLAFGNEFGSDLFDKFETDAADFGDYDRMFPIPTGKLAYDSNEFTAPKDLMILATADLINLEEATHPNGYWCGPNYHSGWGTIGMFRISNGGFVFHVGHINWAKNGLSVPWNEISQITKNVIEILGKDFEPQPFLFDNSDFENQLTGWEKIGGGNSTIFSPGYQSNNCVFIDASTSSDTFLTQRYIPIRTGTNYKISCFVKPGLPADSSSSSLFSISLETLDLNDIPLNEFIIASYPSGNDGWLEISAVGILSGIGQEVIMILTRVKLNVKGGSSAYFDDVVVEEL